MSTTEAPIYTNLDSNTQLAIINARIRDLETQQLQLALRVQAPAPGDQVSPIDQDNLTQLETSLATLRDMADKLTNPPAAPPAPTPASGGNS